jgi:hypothetical protein
MPLPLPGGGASSRWVSDTVKPLTSWVPPLSRNEGTVQEASASSPSRATSTAATSRARADPPSVSAVDPPGHPELRARGAAWRLARTPLERRCEGRGSGRPAALAVQGWLRFDHVLVRELDGTLHPPADVLDPRGGSLRRRDPRQGRDRLRGDALRRAGAGDDPFSSYGRSGAAPSHPGRSAASRTAATAGRCRDRRGPWHAARHLTDHALDQSLGSSAATSTARPCTTVRRRLRSVDLCRSDETRRHLTGGYPRGY